MQRDRLLLAEMIEACQRISEIAGRIGPGSSTDRDLLDAFLWNFTVLGEAAGQVSDELKAAHPWVSWSDPVRLRNRIVHGYWSVEFDVLLSTARGDIPGLRAELQSLVGQGERGT